MPAFGRAAERCSDRLIIPPADNRRAERRRRVLPLLVSNVLLIGRLVRPIVATPPALVTVIEQGAHVLLIERRRQLFGKIGADVGQVEFDVIALCVVIPASL